LHGAQLKPDHGQSRRFVILTTGETLELIYDLNAVMRHEKEFELQLRGALEQIRDAIVKRQPKTEKGDPILPTAKEMTALIGQELLERRLAPGQIEDLAQWAYALTETWREDNGPEMTWQQFKRLLPAPPPVGTSSKKAAAKLAAAMGWMTAVAEVRAREELDDDDQGNELAEEPDASPSAENRESIGTDSITSQPANGAELTANSGE